MKRFLLALLLCLVAAWDCHAVPISIRNFDVTVDVQEDGSILVEERLKVKTSPGGHGIFRDIPVVTRWREQGRAGMEVLAVLLDGKPRPADDIERDGNVVRVYQRDRARTLEPGLHDFVLRYRMTGQVGMFEKNDELTWNVTGHQWESPIAYATCEIRCPRGAGFYGQAAWLDRHGGRAGAPVSMSRREENGRQVMAFAASVPVQPGWELTVAAGWQKGFVTLPEGNVGLDRMAEIWSCVLALGLLLYFSIAWLLTGKDPKKGVIIPLFHPPLTSRGQRGGAQGPVSPAAVCYLRNKAQVTPESFGCALISMAVRGSCQVSGNAKEGFSLKRLPAEPAHDEEHAIWEELPAGEMPVDRKHGEELHDMRSAMSASLHDAYKGIWKGSGGRGLINQVFGSFWTVLGMVAAFAGIATIVSMLDKDLFDSALAFFGVFAAACLFTGKFFRMVVLRWKSQSRATSFVMAFFCVPFILVFWGALLFDLGKSLWEGLTAYQLGFLLLTLTIPVCFSFIMDAPSKEARALLDQIEGLAMYIGMAEKDRLNLVNPPSLTVEHFEELMPYALALGLEDAWGSRFADVLNVAALPAQELMHSCGALSGMADASASSWESAQAASSASSFGGGGGGAGGGGGGGGGGGC